MTGPNPIQIVQTKGVGEELLDAVRPLLETLQRQRLLEERRLELEQQKEELKVRQGDLQLRQDEYQHNIMQGETTGHVIQALIQAAGAGGPPPGTATLTLPSQPGTAPQQGEDPQSAALRLLASAPPGSVQSALASTKIDVAKILGQRSAQMEFNKDVDEAAARLSPEKRQPFKVYMALRAAAPDAAGIDKIAPNLFPELFPKEISPELMNAIWRVMEGGRGYITFGQARQLAGIGPVKGWNDSFMLPKEIKPPTTEQISSMPGYIMMRGAGDRIDEIEDAQMARKGSAILGGGKVGLSWGAQNRRVIQQTAQQGGWGIATGAVLIQQIMQMVTSNSAFASYRPEDTQMLNNTLRFATAVKFALSGKQATLNESLTFLELVTPFASDDPQTIRDKREFRHAIQAGIELMVLGTPPTKELLDQIVRDAGSSSVAKAGGSMIQAWAATPRDTTELSPQDQQAAISASQIDSIIHQRIIPTSPVRAEPLFPNIPR